MALIASNCFEMSTTTWKCGDCHACCHYLTIDDPELTKSGDSLCRHCVPGSGCKFYENRPQSCRDFLCSWRRLPLAEEWRPDRSQILIVHEPGDPASGVKEGLNFFFCGRLDRIFWRPFVDFVASLIAADEQVYISVPGPEGHWAHMLPIEPIPVLKEAIAAGDHAAVVSVVAAIVQNCLDSHTDRIVFNNAAKTIAAA